MEILLVEDEPKVVANIKKGLEEKGFNVYMAANGIEAKKLFKSNTFDLVILDILLPGLDGISLCSYFKSKNPNIKIIFLTALSTLDDKLKGFGAGADDYLCKPFEFLELLARVNSLLQRTLLEKNKQNLIKVADLELNLNTKKARRNNQDIELTAKEYALLEYLMRNQGVVVSRTEIAEKVWDINFDTGTNVIDVYINFLRKKIDKNHPKKLLHTLIGMGYILKDED